MTGRPIVTNLRWGPFRAYLNRWPGGRSPGFGVGVGPLSFHWNRDA